MPVYVYVNKKWVNTYHKPEITQEMSCLWKTTFYKKGDIFGGGNERVWRGGIFTALFPEMGGAWGTDGEKSNCFTFSGAGSCKWLTSKGVMRGTVWKPSSTEGGLVPFSLGLLFSFTILTPFFPDLRQAVGFWLQWEVKQGKRGLTTEKTAVSSTGPLGFQCRDQSSIYFLLDFMTWFSLSSKTSLIIKICHLPMEFNSPQIQENSRKSQTYTNNIQALKKNPRY